MKKICFILFILSMLLHLSESIDNTNKRKFYSKLIEMVRTDIIYKSLQYLPKRNNINIFQMSIEMKKIKNQYSLNDEN